MRKSLLLLALILAASVPSLAQAGASVTQQANGPANVAGLLYAANFGHWTISPTADGNRWTSPDQCFGVSGGQRFPLFSTTAPITIVDLATPANTETVTPTIASYLGSGCSVGLPATHPHANYYLQSGTLGLQEAMNFAGSSKAVIVVTPDWSTMGGTTGMLTSATAGTNTSLIDARTSNQIQYTCSTTCTAVTPSGGTVTAVSVATANGVSGTSSGGATPALTIILGAITPTSTNGVTAASMLSATAPTVGQAACIKAAGPPIVIGTCSTVVGSGGACTCN